MIKHLKLFLKTAIPIFQINAILLFSSRPVTNGLVEEEDRKELQFFRERECVFGLTLST